MNLRIENYDPAKHDARTVAELIYAADDEFNGMLYGDRESGVAVIAELMQMEKTYFSPENIYCAIGDGGVIGVMVGYTGGQKGELDASSGKGFMHVLGFWKFLKRMPTFFRMDKIVTKDIEADSLYMNSFCVDPAMRGRGIGEQMIAYAAERYPRVCLDVNIHNSRAQKFYKRVGFKIQAENTIWYKKEKIGTFSMVKG